MSAVLAPARPRDFVDLRDWGAEAALELAQLALQLKRRPLRSRPLEGRSVGLCFLNPSLRTQASFQVAAASLGAHPVTLHFGNGTWNMEWRDGTVMDGGASEHLKEAVPVLARYCDLLALRAFAGGASWAEDKAEPWLSSFRRSSTVPVVSLESAMGHPCQGLADLMTLQERVPAAGRKFVLAWAPHIKALPLAVPHSAAQAAVIAGMDLTVCRPAGYDLDPGVMDWCRTEAARQGRTVTVTDDPQGAFEGAAVVYAKAWGSLERYGEPPPQDAPFRDLWRLSAAKMARTDNALFMHCLPVRRNLVVDDAVLDSPASVVIDQAENRLHTAKALLLTLLGGKQ
ncbi:MAG: N-acetylornithine carbamoyltransferase [Elusimicrobia bacterium]|nr:N-acetylornithine carbamoyltransferase [Elusimicrobiota bacterium]